MSEKREGEIGAIWIKSGPRGDFLSGEINGVQFVAFPTGLSNPRAPFYRVLKSRPRQSAQGDTEQW